MLIFDFYSGTGSSTEAFVDHGHRVVKIELDESFEADERDILDLTPAYLIDKYGQPDFIWASPPCTTFSVASIGKHWNLDKTPKSQAAVFGIVLVQHTINLINALNAKKGYVIENPRGMLRKLPVMADLTRHTVTYCQYGDSRMKPTDLWTNLNWTPRPTCANGDKCHEAAPRGSRTGTQGLKGSKERSRVPYQLSMELHNLICDTPY